MMPLLHRKPFHSIAPPSDLDPDEEVFHCTLTNEIFRDYEEFYERTILCNSLVWSCAITERPNLTYQEALDCEKAAKKKLSKVSPTILKPLMYLVGLSSISRVDDLNEEVYSFMKERYFLGESVEVQTQKKKMKQPGRIVKVSVPVQSTVNGHLTSNEDESESSSSSSDDDDDDVPLSTFKPAKPVEAYAVSYIVRLHDGTEAHVKGSAIRRKQGVYNRQTSKLLLKSNCVKRNGLVTEIYVVKEDVKKKLSLDKLKWEDMFAGPKPLFSSQKSQKMKKMLGSDASRSKLDKGKIDKLREKEKEELKLARELEREEKKKSKDEEKKKRAEEVEKMREAARLDKEKKRKEREEELLKLKEERETIRIQKQEEKRRLAEYLKEWGRPRDDLECDDLQELPTPHEIHSRLPPSLFGEVLSLLEFFNSFGDLFEAADEFPDGVSLELLIDAIVERKHNGSLCDLLFFFLSNLFRTQMEEEESWETIHADASDPEVALQLRDNISEETLQAFATLSSTWSTTYQGCPLRKLELDSYTVTEILRLYLLTSASRPRGEDRLWRFQQRGGYSGMDDTPFNLYMRRPKIAPKLSTVNVFDLEPDEKISLLTCLAHHLLTFVVPRDRLDEAWDKLQQAQIVYRDDRAAEKRREREGALEKSKFKCEQMNLEKQARLKEFEDGLRRSEEGRRDVGGEDNDMKQEEDDNDAPKLLDPLERAKRLRLFDEEESQAKEAWNFRRHKHELTIDKHQCAFRVSSLGQDRYYRRYWSISSIPGVFVEEFPDDDLTNDMLLVRVPQKSHSSVSLSGYSTPGLSDCSTVGTPIQGGPPAPAAPIIGGTPTPGPPGGSATPQFQPMNGVVMALSSARSFVLTSPSSGTTSDNHLTPQRSIPVITVNGQPMQSGGEERPPEELKQGKQYKWSIYQNADEIENLISALNSRGYRESKLRNKLIAMKDVITTNLSNKKRHLVKLFNLRKPSEMVTTTTRCEREMDLLLRDQILDLEGKIWAGTLGFTKLSSRHLWREALQTGGEYDGVINEDTSPPTIQDDEDSTVVCAPSVEFPLQISDQDVDSGSPSSDDSGEKRIKDLATALLIVERAVDRKYLKHPLGWAVDTRKGSRGRSGNNENVAEETKKKASLLLKRWETSLLSCTSLSQIFLHLSTLERSITWSRSILNAKCRICRRKGDGEKMLLCDSCDRGHHMYCLRPAIKNVPAGDWYCPDCKPRSAKISPRKVVRTKSFAQDDSSDEESSEEDDEALQEDLNDDESCEEVEEPVKKKLTYKLPSKSKKNTTANKTNGKRARKSDSSKVDIGSSKRRSASVWKDIGSCEDILSEMIKHKDSWPFVDPVSKKLVPDYYSIIKKPMDLGTVLKKLKNVQYASPSDFVDDVDLIFENCHIYNDPRSNIAKTASNLKAFFESKLEEKGLSSYRQPVNKAKKRRTN